MMIKPIKKSTGTTPSEIYLAELAEISFLNLWSYPNVFVDRRGDGKVKELCDLLVICGDDVLIFSDKSIGWPGTKDLDLAWERWYRRAITNSVKQLRKAANFIDKFPDQLYLDPRCGQKLPLSLPPKDRMRVHGIVVALGAGEACKQHFGEGIGSLLISSYEEKKPFLIGDVNKGGFFVHVLDDASLTIVMSELDTISDLTGYLTKKENLIRSGKLAISPGEKELVAYYMTHMNSDDEHDFTLPDGTPLGENHLGLAVGHYEALLSNPQYRAKKELERVSYVWDGIIENFTTHMMAGTTVVYDDLDFKLHEQEVPVRHMALVPRFMRRIYGEKILDILKKGRSAPRATRAFLPHPNSTDKSTCFFYLVLKVPDFELAGGYEQYRTARRNMLEIYALSYLNKYPELESVIGIASEPPGSNGGSEDIFLMEQPRWDDELLGRLEKAQKRAGIMKEDTYKEYSIHSEEYPDLEPSYSKKQRSKKKKIGRNKKCSCGSGRKYKYCCLR